MILKATAFVFGNHRDRVNEEKCRMSGAEVPQTATIYEAGKHSFAYCPFCDTCARVRATSQFVQIGGAE